MNYNYSKALQLIDFYNRVGWDSLLYIDKLFLLEEDLNGIPTRVIDKAMVFNNGAVRVGSCNIPEDYYNYLISIGVNYIRVEQIKEYG